MGCVYISLTRMGKDIQVIRFQLILLHYFVHIICLCNFINKLVTVICTICCGKVFIENFKCDKNQGIWNPLSYYHLCSTLKCDKIIRYIFWTMNLQCLHSVCSKIWTCFVHVLGRFASFWTLGFPAFYYFARF